MKFMREWPSLASIPQKGSSDLVCSADIQCFLFIRDAMGRPYRGNPVVGVVGELASMKRRKLWKTGGDWAVLLQQ